MLRAELIEARPGLASAIATGDDDALDRIERMITMDRIEHARAAETPAAQNARAEAAMRRMWPSWK